MVELLSPAGNPSALKAAVEAGADAVYFGSEWNARLRARNFTKEEIARAIKYCHSNNVKAYITVNTLIFEEELPAVSDYLSFIYSQGADAIIVQDLGVARIARELGNDMEIHASTQLSVHNSKTAKILKNIGFDRLVLARELNLDQVMKIKNNAGVEVEIFVHGALCYSYSGKCLWSFAQTGRSGNRGICSQMCRFPWKLECEDKKMDEKKGYFTSTKDLKLIEHINEIKKAGIDCIKIEGRLKGPDYVREVTSKYRKAIDGEIEQISPSPRGFTSGYLFNEARTSKLINPKAQRFSGEMIGKVVSVSKEGAEIKLNSKLSKGDLIRSSSSAKLIEVFRIYKNGKEVENASEQCLLKIKTLKKGDIIYKEKREKEEEDYLKSYSIEKVRTPNKYSVKTQKLDLELRPISYFSYADISRIKRNELVVLDWDDEDLDAHLSKMKGKCIPCIDTPRVVFDEEMNDIEKRMKSLKEKYNLPFMISELSMLSEYECYISPYANVSNSLAAEEWLNIGKNIKGIVGCPEMGEERANRIGLMYYSGRLELAISENDWYNEMGIRGKCSLVDPRGNRYPIIKKGNRTVILQPTPKR